MKFANKIIQIKMKLEVGKKRERKVSKKLALFIFVLECMCKVP